MRIARINGDDISFSPWDSETFIDEATKALKNWRMNNPTSFDWDVFLAELDELEKDSW